MNDIQMWNNAAFDDNRNANDMSFFPIKTSWSSSESTKENMSPPASNYSSIDAEIDDIEREINRLTTRLDALRLEKSKRAAKRVVGRVIPAKFMDPKPKPKPNPDALVSRKPPLEETPKVKSNNNCRRRGMSMGPAEIAATPATAQTHRRKSCFWKLPEIDEVSKAKTTVSRVKKKEEPSLVAQVQPRKLFEREKVKSVLNESNNNKKGFLKQGRVVASRYNSARGSDVRKRSLPEGGSEIRVKKRWEIPKNTEEAAAATTVVLPKIKTVKCVNESPRDSGAAKRVAELVGKRSYFITEEKDVCQTLNFAEEEEEEEG